MALYKCRGTVEAESESSCMSHFTNDRSKPTPLTHNQLRAFKLTFNALAITQTFNW